MIQTSDGGFLLGGYNEEYRNDTWEWDIFILKTNEIGHELWTYLEYRQYTQLCYGVSEIENGNYLICGKGNRDGLVMEFDSEGNEISSRTYGGDGSDYFEVIVQLENGDRVFGGTTGSFGHGNRDIWLLKTDSNGQVIWSRAYGGDAVDALSTLKRTNDGGFIFGGGTYSFGVAGADVYVVKTDVEGDEEWSYMFGDSLIEYCSAIVELVEGGYVVAGTYGNRAGPDDSDYLLIKLDENGEEVWWHIYDVRGSSSCFDMIQTTDGGFVLAGRMASDEYFVMRTDPVGDELWRTDFGFYDDPFRDGEFRSVVQTPDGGYALAGTESWPYDFSLFKTSPDPVSVPYLIDPNFPANFTLHAPYPNPFNSTTSISYSIPFYLHVSLSVFDLSGRRTVTLVDECTQPGIYSTTLKSDNMASGTYFIRLQSAKTTQSYKIVLLK